MQAKRTPRVEILGVYRLSVSKDLVREQVEASYGTDLSAREQRDAERQCREQLESVAQIEVLVHDRDSRFSIEHFTQPDPRLPPANWQSAWAESFLAHDGLSSIGEPFGDVPDVEPLRVAFFIHFWQPELPLRCSYGDLPCPAPQPMPDRLARLAPYQTLD